MLGRILARERIRPIAHSWFKLYSGTNSRANWMCVSLICWSSSVQQQSTASLNFQRLLYVFKVSLSSYSYKVVLFWFLVSCCDPGPLILFLNEGILEWMWLWPWHQHLTMPFITICMDSELIGENATSTLVSLHNNCPYKPNSDSLYYVVSLRFLYP